MLIVSPVIAKTRSDSVENLLDNVRLSPEGFADTPDESINIEATANVLSIAKLINYEVNSTLDILLYFQRSQNKDGGFGNNPDGDSTWDYTIKAINGLVNLNINSSQLSAWGIDSYLNSSAIELFYTEVTENNQTILKTNELTIDLIQKWHEYIYASVLIGVIPPIPNVFLGSELKSLQFDNGTYNDFQTAVSVVRLLSRLGQEANDAELASKFIRAYASTDGMFASTLQGAPNLENTYDAIIAINDLGRLAELEDKRDIILKILNLQKADSGFSDIDSSEVTIQSTWYAVQILSLLDSLDQLESPDVLQTEGFITLNLLPTLIVLSIIIYKRRR